MFIPPYYNFLVVGYPPNQSVAMMMPMNQQYPKGMENSQNMTNVQQGANTIQSLVTTGCADVPPIRRPANEIFAEDVFDPPRASNDTTTTTITEENQSESSQNFEQFSDSEDEEDVREENNTEETNSNSDDVEKFEDQEEKQQLPHPLLKDFPGYSGTFIKEVSAGGHRKAKPDSEDKDEPVHTCMFCYRVFSRKGNLQRHIRSHFGIKPFRCRVCLKTFSTKSNMKTHEVTHKKQSHYECDYCSRVFKRVTFFKRHVDAHKRREAAKVAERLSLQKIENDRSSKAGSPWSQGNQSSNGSTKRESLEWAKRNLNLDSNCSSNSPRRRKKARYSMGNTPVLHKECIRDDSNPSTPFTNNTTTAPHRTTSNDGQTLQVSSAKIRSARQRTNSMDCPQVPASPSFDQEQQQILSDEEKKRQFVTALHQLSAAIQDPNINSYLRTMQQIRNEGNLNFLNLNGNSLPMGDNTGPVLLPPTFRPSPPFSVGGPQLGSLASHQQAPRQTPNVPVRSDPVRAEDLNVPDIFDCGFYNNCV